MQNQNVVPSEQDPFSGLRFVSRDSLPLKNSAGGGSGGRPLNSLQDLETAGRANQEFHLRLEEQRQERARIARELHDTLLQGFFSASMMLQTAVEKMPANSPSKSSLSRALQLMCRVIEDGRAALQGLRSTRIASTSLEQALADFRSEFPLARAQFRILVTGRPKVLNPSIQEEINLIAREALANAFHHSQATNIEAEIEYLPGKLRVVIRDNGCGLDRQAVWLRQKSHWGLLGMQERARIIGADLRIWSRRGLGTQVEVSISSELAAKAGTRLTANKSE
jgi:signal transduction histidine kinase